VKSGCEVVGSSTKRRVDLILAVGRCGPRSEATT